MDKFFGLYYKLSKEQLSIAKDLRENNIESRAVIGRGSVFVEAKDVKQTQKYKDLLSKADELMLNN